MTRISVAVISLFGLISGALGADDLKAPLEPLSYGNAVSVIGSLLFVLAALFVCAWLMRRGAHRLGHGASKIAVISQLPLGIKEKVVLLRVGEQNILVAYAGGNLRTLHAWVGDEPADIDLPPTTALNFGDYLSRLTSKQRGE